MGVAIVVATLENQKKIPEVTIRHLSGEK